LRDAYNQCGCAHGVRAWCCWCQFARFAYRVRDGFTGHARTDGRKVRRLFRAYSGPRFVVFFVAHLETPN
jgi:hypothetical protein